MNTTFVLSQIQRLQSLISAASNDQMKIHGVRAQTREFMRKFAGPNSAFFSLVQEAGGSSEFVSGILLTALENFQSYIEAGLHAAVTPERKAQIDVVSDFLEQAHHLLEGNGIHPAAPIVLVGATLEEFLRVWIDSKEISLGQRKPSLESYGQALLAENLITKQDMKDIISWAGLRNHAAHGEWAEVSEKQRAALMLDGVNMFLRKYAEQ